MPCTSVPTTVPDRVGIKLQVKQNAGRITIAGMTKEVSFESASEQMNNAIDDAYRAKYSSSPYLGAMIGEQARSATVQIFPRE